MKTIRFDPEAIRQNTATTFSKLLELDGITGRTVEARADGSYYIDGVNCGVSVHGMYDWREKQLKLKNRESRSSAV